MSHKYMLNCTNNALSQTTELFDFIWPTALAMWNFRAQAIGYTSVDSETTNEKLAHRFSSSDKTINRAYITKYCSTPWDNHKTYLSKILLGEICAIYDAWCNDMILEITGRHDDIGRLYSPYTYTSAIIEYTGDTSEIMTDYVYPKLKSNKKYNFSNAKHMLICFKYFKECRNSFMHNGGKATQRAADWYEKYDKIRTLGTKEKPKYFKTEKDQYIKLSLRGIVGFTDIVTRLITSFDAEISKGKHAESILAGRIIKKHQIHILPSNRERLVKKITRYINKTLNISSKYNKKITEKEAKRFADHHKIESRSHLHHRI